MDSSSGTPGYPGAPEQSGTVGLSKYDAALPVQQTAVPAFAAQPPAPPLTNGPMQGYAQPGAGGPQSGVPVASGLAMKRRNPWAVWLGLPLITLGIYHLVWYYKIHREMAEFDRRRAIPVAGPMLVLWFLGWTVIAPIVSYNNAGRRIRNAQTSAGLVASCSPTLCWLLWFVFGLNSLYMQVELNKVVDRYAHASPGMQVPLYV